MTEDTLPTPATLDEETLAPPPSRVGNSAGIRSRIAEMRRADRTRAKRRTVMQLIYDGEPPYSRAKLQNKGQGDRTNVNWREAEGMVDQAKTPYYSVVFRQSRFCNIRTCYGDNVQLQDRWSDTISEQFHWLLSQWKSHSYNVQLRDWQMVFFGIGIPMFTDTESPFWEARKIGDVLVPDETVADVEQLGEAVAFRKIDPVKLFRMVDKEKSAKKEGWFPDRAKRAIVKVAPQSLTKSWGEQWSEHYAASLRRGDVIWNAKDSRIPVADYFVKEFSGKVTHCIVLDDGSAGNTNDDGDEGLLFRKEERFECFSQILQPFFFDVGTGEWHSIKGLGPKISDFCGASNRFLCTMIDGARVGSALLLQAKDTSAMQETQLIEISGANVIQPGFEVQQNRIDQSLQGPLAVARELQNKLQNNTGQYLQRVSNDNAEPTLGQAQLNEQNQAQLSESSLDRHMCSMDWLYYEQVRRALKLGMRVYGARKNRDLLPGESYPSMSEAERLSFWFIQRCVQDGVPEEALDFDYIESVRATRGVGGGSPAAVDIATQQLMTMLPMFNEKGRTIVLSLRTASLVGQGLAKEIVPPFDTTNVPSNEAAFATLENNALRQPAGEALVAFDQDHLIHFDAHFQDMADHVQMLRTGQAQPMEVLVHLHNFGPHTRQHLNEMAGDPTRKTQLAQREAAWLAMSKIADQLQQQMEEAMQSQQAQQPQVDPALVAAMAKVHGDLQIKSAKAQGDLQLKAQKQQQMMRLKDLQQAHDMRLKTIQAVQQPALSSGTNNEPALAVA